jgi:hypothetical protein
MAELLEAEFGGRVHPAEERLGCLVRLLRQERLMAYPGRDAEV